MTKQYKFSQTEPETPWFFEWTGIALIIMLLVWGSTNACAQAGDPKWFFRGAGTIDQTGYTTKVNNSLYAINNAGNFSLLAQSNFVSTATIGGYGFIVGPASATSNNVPLWDGTTGKLLKDGLATSIGGNNVSDAGKVVLFRSTGGVVATTGAAGIAISGASVGGVGVDARSTDSWALYAGSANDRAGWFVSSGAQPGVEINANGTGYALSAIQQGGGADDIALFSATSGSLSVLTDGGAEWTGTGAQTTATNLPAFGTSTKGVVPASGGGTANFLRADGTWAAPGGGGVTDHGALTGLADDDHGQYHNDARGDARYSLLGHTHPISEITSLQTTINAINSSIADLISVTNSLFPIAFTGSANDLSSGTVPTARLGSGTANSTTFLRGDNTWQTVGGGSGTVTSVSVTTANGVSGSVATATTTPAISLTLGAITPTSVAASGAVSGSNLSGTNTGDQTSIVGITGSLSDFNTALTGADFATGGGTATGTNTGDQTNISGNAATVTTNANLTGPITSVGNATTVAETELSALASTTSAANKVPYFTGSGTATTANLKIGTEVAYSGTITWTAGTAPSSTSSLRQFYMQVGNMVTWEIALTYAVAGSTVTGISLTFPTEFPTPAIPTGFTGANVKLWQCFPTRLLTSPTSATLNGATYMIQRNAADTGFDISSSVFASGSYRTFHLGGIYFTAP